MLIDADVAPHVWWLLAFNLCFRDQLLRRRTIRQDRDRQAPRRRHGLQWVSLAKVNPEILCSPRQLHGSQRAATMRFPGPGGRLERRSDVLGMDHCAFPSSAMFTVLITLVGGDWNRRDRSHRYLTTFRSGSAFTSRLDLELVSHDASRNNTFSVAFWSVVVLGNWGKARCNLL